MANSSVVSRGQGIIALLLPLAVLIGYLLADPTGFGSIAIVLFIITLLCVPLLMRWHHPLLIISWHATVNPYFLPGRPYLWMLMAGCSLFFSVMNRIVDPERRLNQESSLTRPLLLLALVVVGTGLARGGFGTAAMSSSTYGGKGYYYILAAIAGYFALASVRIAPERSCFYASLFFISGITALIPNAIYAAGPSLNFLFYVFPPEFAMEQAAKDWSLGSGIFRFFGLNAASIGLLSFLLVRYGISGVLLAAHPVRFCLFMLAGAGAVFCGFRSVLILFLLVFAIQFWLEGLVRTRLFPILLGVGIITMGLALPNAEKLPLVVQRTLSFLPIEVDPFARHNAQASAEWRFEIWKLVSRQIPDYLLLGKGYAIDPTQLDIARMGALRGNTAEQAILAGDYHSGPLSLLLPLGLGGTVALLWFWIVALRYLYWNFRHGAPELQTINTFLLAMFLARILFFSIVFGGFSSDLFYFTGLAGLSVAINGPRIKKPTSELEMSMTESTEPMPRRQAYQYE